MKLHILGICGTFMAGIAQIARELGHEVSGSDASTYPPMSTLLAGLDVDVANGYRAENVPPDVDMCLIGNAMSRGNPEVEHILDNRHDFMSGPEWLHREVLRHRDVIAVAGTHGKTTTTSMVCHVLESAGEHCGFLVGGVPGNFEVSARLGDGRWFVIEADEYDTAFFDKRSKFVHYHPRIAILNNLEYDHADIFDDLSQIKTQFHHLVRTIPGSGTIVANKGDENVMDTLSRGCWSRVRRFATGMAGGDTWRFGAHAEDYSAFEVIGPDERRIDVSWRLFGAHNAVNALAACAACDAAGIDAARIARGLSGFEPPRRRLQLLYDENELRVYEDFAHHPTAIATTLDALRARHPGSRLLAVVEMRSNTMRGGIHRQTLTEVLARPEASLVLRGPDMQWDPADMVDGGGEALCETFDDAGSIVERLLELARAGDVIVLMSNGGFQALPRRLLDKLAIRTEREGVPDVHSRENPD